MTSRDAIWAALQRRLRAVEEAQARAVRIWDWLITPLVFALLAPFIGLFCFCLATAATFAGQKGFLDAFGTGLLVLLVGTPTAYRVAEPYVLAASAAVLVAGALRGRMIALDAAFSGLVAGLALALAESSDDVRDPHHLVEISVVFSAAMASVLCALLARAVGTPEALRDAADAGGSGSAS